VHFNAAALRANKALEKFIALEEFDGLEEFNALEELPPQPERHPMAMDMAIAVCIARPGYPNFPLPTTVRVLILVDRLM
jgi:hypothetical protein